MASRIIGCVSSSLLLRGTFVTVFLVDEVDLRKYTNYHDLVIAYVSCIAWFGRGCIHRGAVSLKESVKKN